LYSWQLLQAHFIALAAGLKPDLASLAQGVHGTDETTLARRLEHDVDNFCTLQAVHHAVQYARDELERAGGLLLKAEEAHAVLVCAFLMRLPKCLMLKVLLRRMWRGNGIKY
jgi:hypothetical protein